MISSYTVSEISDIIKKTLQDGFKNKTVSVTGEISNVKSSGKHTYLTLKDDNASISVAFWGSQLDNDHGDNVEITGKIDYYTQQGKVNFIGKGIKNIGVGALHAEYEKIKKNYEQKGYFNNSKPLLTSVKKIGLVTAETGAALKDFEYVLKKNDFSGNVYIYDCIVQGPKCPASVAAGIKFFNSAFLANVTVVQNDTSISTSKSKKQIKDDSESDTETDTDTNSSDFDPFAMPGSIKKHRFLKNTDEVEVDIIIVMRGGGSFEDLMGFSDPKVIDAIYNSKKYIISAVGHEIDNMLSDYVANYRAPTPSIAGEVICSINDNNRKKLSNLEHRALELRHTMLQELFRFKNHINLLRSSMIDPTKQIETDITSIFNRATSHIKNKLNTYRSKILEIREILNSNDVNKILDGGFVLLTDKNGMILKDMKDVFNNTVMITHATGQYEVMITDRNNVLTSTTSTTKTTKTTKRKILKNDTTQTI